MAQITTLGGSGTVSGTQTNPSAVNGAIDKGEITVFTTPATTDATFIVTLQVLGMHNTNTLATLGCLSASGQGFIGTGAVFASTSVGATGTYQMKVGPSTAVKVAYIQKNGTTLQGSFDYQISYSYVSAVVG